MMNDWQPLSNGDDDDNDDVSFVVLAEAGLVTPRKMMTKQEKHDERAAAHKLIRAKYDAGIPFFTKELIRSVVEQLDDPSSKTVAIRGLDGVDVHFTIDTGKPYDFFAPREGKICIVYGYSAGHKIISTKPQLWYKTVADLLWVPDSECSPLFSPYLPVALTHSTEIRHAITNALLPPFPVLSDPAAASQRFERARRSWDESELFVQIKAALASAAVPPGIDKVVALACFSVSCADDEDAATGMAQHALALAVRDFLAARDAAGREVINIKCYAQDPIYTPVDEQVLSGAGFAVVDDPRAFLEVDEASAVVCFSPNIPVRQIVADLARPGLLIWNKVESNKSSDEISTDPVSTRVLRMMEEYDEVPWPAETQSEHFVAPAIYVRKAA